MNWYEVLWRENTVRNPLVADTAEYDGISKHDLEIGRGLSDWRQNVRFTVTKPENEGDPDDILLNDDALPVFSTRLQAELISSGIQGIQFLPVEVFRLGGVSVPGYAIANILHLVPALDLQLSKYERYPEDFPAPELQGQISIIKAVLVGAKLVGQDIIRLEEDPVGVYVSERFRDLLVKGRYTGIGFQRVPLSGVSAGSGDRRQGRISESCGSPLDDIASLVSASESPTQAWCRLSRRFRLKGLDLGEQLGDVDVVAAVAEARVALAEVLRREPIPAKVGFLYFGLFDMIADGEQSASVGFYISGGEDFDPRDSDTLCDLAYFPANGIIRSQLLDRIAQLALQNTSRRDLIEYEATFGVAAILARFGLPRIRRALRLVVGFDEGDYAEIAGANNTERL